MMMMRIKVRTYNEIVWFNRRIAAAFSRSEKAVMTFLQIGRAVRRKKAYTRGNTKVTSPEKI